ncbi:MAG TPA: glycosyltransferase family 2 protein [Candidatus Phocaeicola gallistercoris]|nr:glycosyltransferase family 2 protein [Candidatus Phocaeicola gallistercoris]
MKLVIVVPCYNEEEVLPETTAQLSRVLDGLRGKKAIDQGIILYVDDGSKDTTWRLVQKYATENPYVKGLKLAHNVGHQQALWAGLEWASQRADAAVSIDADLQDDVDAIGTMVDYYNRGVDIVYGVRRERKVDTFFKKGTALAFYRLMRNLGGEIVYNHADFRLMSRRTLLALMAFPERNLFLRGIVASMGYPSAVVYYDRKERFAGESKYPLKKMISFALDGITSFSVRPLRYITYLGLFFMLIAVFAIFYGLFSYVEGSALPGWTSLLVSMWFIGGAILLACGIIGEYVGKIYKEVKQRPRYFIENETD